MEKKEITTLDKIITYFIWFAFNLGWWFLSIYISFVDNIDVNPFFGNKGEIVLNTIIFMIGLIIIYLYHDYKESSDSNHELEEDDE